LAFYCLFLAVGQTSPPVEPGDTCIGVSNPAIFAYVSVINDPFHYEPCAVVSNSHDPIFGEYGGMAAYNKSSDSFYFKTTLDISELISGNNSGSIHFAEISTASSSGVLPSMVNMIVDATISYHSNTGYSLIVNYQTIAGIDSLIIGLDDDQILNVQRGSSPDFDVTIAWINSGCVHMTPGCDQSTGELEVRIDYSVGTIVESVNGLQYQSSSSRSVVDTWQAMAVYWGDLGRDNLAGELRLARP